MKRFEWLLVRKALYECTPFTVYRLLHRTLPEVAVSYRHRPAVTSSGSAAFAYALVLSVPPRPEGLCGVRPRVRIELCLSHGGLFIQRYLSSAAPWIVSKRTWRPDFNPAPGI